jgi:hypothetical protein
MVTAGMAGAALAAFLAWYWSLPSWSGWSAACTWADRPPAGRDILDETGIRARSVGAKEARNDPAPYNLKELFDE